MAVTMSETGDHYYDGINDNIAEVNGDQSSC